MLSGPNMVQRHLFGKLGYKNIPKLRILVFCAPKMDKKYCAYFFLENSPSADFGKIQYAYDISEIKKVISMDKRGQNGLRSEPEGTN